MNIINTRAVAAVVRCGCPAAPSESPRPLRATLTIQFGFKNVRACVSMSSSSSSMVTLQALVNTRYTRSLCLFFFLALLKQRAQICCFSSGVSAFIACLFWLVQCTRTHSVFC